MMGLPRSLDDLTRSEQIDLIAGNTRLGPDEIFPTSKVYKVSRPLVLDGVYRCNPAIPPWRYANAIAMDIPEDDHRPRHENIHYFDEAETPLAMNEFEVPDTELVRFNRDKADDLERYKTLLYKGASSLSALHDAAEYVEAALFSGLDIELDMDEALLKAFVSISRLDALAAMVKATSNLTEGQQASYLEKITAFMAERTALALDKHDTGEQMRRGIQAQKELYARVRPAEEIDYLSRMQQQSDPMPTLWGVRGTRQR
jgi:hypothetical protein|uniref:Uncharacterized protein n=1 Tax=Myoviridae sp. ctshb19 TaxID=2825194 RepID=A0A8S5UGJ2_9CAUD|nr:MAG TPA: hypothetical protein [Myoviridae sp. ctshb19]